MDTITAVDCQHMASAMRLAERGVYTTTPNPHVGCVLVKDGAVLAQAWHQKAGQDHAEAAALRLAGSAAQGATCYITLEPCSHVGRTAACADALIAAGVTRVVYAMEDPNPLVAGDGIQKLREAGISVAGPVMQSEARKLNAGFIKRMSSARPRVQIKLAMSLDGRTSMPDGNSFWITGPQSRSDVHRLRARSCAILSGWRSVSMDQAQMTVRPEEFAMELPFYDGRQPLRVLLDAQNKLPEDARFFAQKSPILVANRSQNSTQGHIERKVYAAADGHLDIAEILADLADRGINNLLVETGPELAAAFFKIGVVDEVILYVAAKIMGSAANPLLQLPLQKMAEALPMHITDIRQLDGDVRITAMPETE